MALVHGRQHLVGRQVLLPRVERVGDLDALMGRIDPMRAQNVSQVVSRIVAIAHGGNYRRLDWTVSNSHPRARRMLARAPSRASTPRPLQRRPLRPSTGTGLASLPLPGGPGFKELSGGRGPK